MFCSECGNQLPGGTLKFCPECGAKLPVRETEPVKVAEPVQAAEPVKEPEPVAPMQKSVVPAQRPVTPMAMQQGGTPTPTQQKPSMVMKKKTGIDSSYFKNRNYLMVLIGNILAFIGCFIPFVSIFGSTISLMELTVGGGSAIIIAIIVCIVFTFVKPLAVYIPCIISVCIYGANFMSLIAEGLLETLHIGAYLILVATIVALVGALKLRKEYKSSAE